ncbi:multicopper oxidase domain-containing protein [Pasteurella bettyae]|uniref:Cell division protein FtsP n=1 Tax=Pasteurella bettyae CCUG 2042 TaxID=1095749 RepID=I3DIV0_9PAST|nr:multicopper oxidase domain-containing protein [Pasteurella bettyae]EIJ71643.1 multicopper oxidase [Pasteurella bettyae CCUG 2042]SUB22299.1 protein SufI [Pasteurella bettyae]
MENYSRRQFFKRTLIATALTAIPMPLLAASRQPLIIPPVLESSRGRPVILSTETTQFEFNSGKLVEVWGFNGRYLGPTVRVKQGDFVKLTWRNNLSQLVAFNIQGLQASGELIGGIGHGLKPGQAWSPILPISQPAATCYYHACTLASSAYQTYRGLVGLWIVEDEESRKAKLPNKYGVNDIPLILQDHKINSTGTQLFQQNEPHFYGERLLVNGQESPYLSVSRGWIRLRIVNASLSRAYDLRMEDDRDLFVIAKDQGFLPQSKAVKNIFVAPGERVELLVDLNEGGNVSLIAGAKRGIVDKAKLLFDSDNELSENTVLEFRPEGLLSVFNGNPNLQFTSHAMLPKQITQERSFHIDASNGMINQKRFDPRRIDINVKQGSIERWHLTSSIPTGFYIQGAKFLIESIDGQVTEESELVWKDTVWIKGNVQLIVKFDNLSSNMQPFLFGASDLMQADKGAIGLIVVQ